MAIDSRNDKNWDKFLEWQTQEARKEQKSMKVIDLLNKISKSEEVPELVKYNGIIYNYVAIYRHGMRYIDLDETDENFRYLMFNVNNLNDEVEIIEDTPKENKKIKRIEERESWWPNMADGNVSTLKQAINEIIDRLNGDE